VLSGPTQLPINWVPEFFHGGKATGVWSLSHTHTHTHLNLALRFRMSGVMSLPTLQAFTGRRGTSLPLSLPLQMWAAIAQSVQRLATGWTVRRSNPGGDEIFRTRSDRPWGPPSLLYNWYRVFPGDKAAGAWRWLPTPSSDEVKERVELYLYSPSGSSWPVIGWPLSLPL